MARTPNKGRKSLSLWETCSQCESILQPKDTETHKAGCGVELDDWNWKHNFIKNHILHGTLEVADIPSDRSEEEASNMVFMSMDVMQMCNISLGEPVLLSFKHICVVKSAWPGSGKSLISVSLVRSAIDLDHLEGPFKLQRLINTVYLADELTLIYRGKNKLPSSDELSHFLKTFNENKIVTTNNKINIRYYGRSFTFTISSIDSSELRRKSKKIDLSSQMDKLSLQENEQMFYKIIFSSNFKVQATKLIDSSELRFRYCMDDIGGYADVIEDLKHSMEVGTEETTKYSDCGINKGILLYGFPGVGKTMIAEAILNDWKKTVIVVKFAFLYTKFFDKAELMLNQQFEEAKQSAPSIIYIEDLDVLFRKENHNDHKSKLLLVLINLLDSIQDYPITILATTSRLEDIDPLLRKPGRIHKAFEVAIPSPDTRKEIIEKLLIKVDHNLSPEDVAHVAFVTHGYVGADLKELCSEATVNAKKYAKYRGSGGERVRAEDFIAALGTVRPSAMRGVEVEVSNVRWNDIGGQEEIKLKLKQALEWPLKYPEAFERFGIDPPRGVLLYGPPGCSKTMIAKACATESKMNFLLVRASELFSKWVGESEKAVREVFRKARQVAPSIIFIDEIETIGRGRGSNNEGNNVDEKVLSLILTELDGVTALGNVTVIGATNRPDKVDEALLRPERFDRIIYVPLPDITTRREIFKIKLKKVTLQDVDIEKLISQTEGYSGAEIQLVCKEAVLNALKTDITCDKVTMDDFDVALSVVRPRVSDTLIQIYEKFKL